MTMRRGIPRLIDANFNRSREGLRVCEDIARFVLNSKTLSGELKCIRHGISRSLGELPSGREALLNARDVDEDVGRRGDRKREVAREDLLDIFTANMERVKESLRVLEEMSKLTDRNISDRFSQLRFKVYDIEKKAFKKISSLRDIR